MVNAPQNFKWLLLTLIVLLAVLSFAGNAFTRGSFACKYCGQRGLWLPCAKLF